MDWIDEESKKIRAFLDSREQTEYLINFSNYWASLIHQIERNVIRINESAEWREILKEEIRFEHTDNGCRIRKVSYPAVFCISIENHGKEIAVKTEYKKSDSSEREINTDVLNVEFDGKYIVLRRGYESFTVPEEAAKYILKLILKAKADCLEYFSTH